MKLLMIYCTKFSYKAAIKNLDFVKNISEEKTFENSLVAFIQVEEKDEENIASIEKKLVKNLKWAAKKNESNTVILHSFAHLSESKAKPEITQELFNKAELRLQNANYQTAQTPFGYFLDLEVKAPGYSLARIFKDL